MHRIGREIVYSNQTLSFNKIPTTEATNDNFHKKEIIRIGYILNLGIAIIEMIR